MLATGAAQPQAVTSHRLRRDVVSLRDPGWQATGAARIAPRSRESATRDTSGAPCVHSSSSGEAGSSGDSAGPANTWPVGLKREPWHGQSQVDSAAFQLTMQPRWVQTGESVVT